MKSNLNILEKVLNFSMCLLVCVEREREREREETMGLRNWEIILEEMRIKMGDEVKLLNQIVMWTSHPLAMVYHACEKGKNLKATFKRVGCNAWIHSQPNGLAP